MKAIRKINIKNSVVAILSIVLMISGCQKILDVETNDKIPNENAIQTTRDLDLVLTGAYDALQGLLNGELIVYADMMSYDTEIKNSQRLSAFGKYEIYNRQTTSQIQEIANVWFTAYTAINRANNVIYAIDNNLVDDVDFEANKDRIKGEALFIRAICHFEIVRWFALPYDVTMKSNNTQLGVPYKITPTLDSENVHQARNSVEEVYNNVIQDLKDAITLLDSIGQTTTEYNERASSLAAAAYLARVYFQMGDYNNAATYAGTVINSGQFSLNANVRDIWQTLGYFDTEETIFQILNLETDNSNSLIDNYSYNRNPLFKTTMDVFDMYQDIDLRKDLIDNYYNLNVLFYVQKYDPVDDNYYLNRIIIRLAEMHLIRAESNLMADGPGNIADAFESYNALRERAFGDDYTPETVMTSDLLDSVRLERRRELVFEGDRYHDLRRLQQPVRDDVAWNDATLVFKIPALEVSGNDLMEQNP